MCSADGKFYRKRLLVVSSWSLAVGPAEVGSAQRLCAVTNKFDEDGQPVAGPTNGGLCLADDQQPTTDDGVYVFALAFSLTWPPSSSTEYSTFSQWYCLRICSVFFCTKVVKESRLPETLSPAFFLAATSVL